MKEGYKNVDKAENIPIKAVLKALGIMAIVGLAMIGGYFVALYFFGSYVEFL